MPKSNSVTAAVPVVNSNAMELTGPVEDDFLAGKFGDSELGSHRLDDDSPDTKTESVATDDGDEIPEEKIPARLKGKTLAQVYQEFAGLEQEYSRQGNELGEARGLLRQTLEQVIERDSRGAPAEDESADEITDEDFHTNPKAAVAKIVSEKIKPIEQRALTAEQKLIVREFNDRHPGYVETAKSPEFKEWVTQSPYRTKLFKTAAGFDMDAAEELFSAWEEKVAATKNDESDDGQPDATVVKRRAIKQVATETGSAGKGVGNKGGKKFYKAAEIMRLYINDRDKYNEMSEEIKAAYREGRVK